jgi:mannosyltransferase
MRLERLTLAALAAIVGAAALLRFWALGRQGMWYDEGVTGWLMRFSPGEILGAIPKTESNPPLYYLVAWAWTRLFGDTAAGLRSLSALAGVATVPVTFAAGRALVGRRVGLVAAALVAVSPLLIWYSQEARNYSLFVLLAATSLWLFARARDTPTAGRLLAWAVVSAFALCTHYFAAFLLAPQALWLLGDRRASLWWRLASIAVVSATGLALAGLALEQRGNPHWLGSVGLRVRAVQIPEQFLVGFRPPATRAALAVAGVVAMATLVLLAVRSDRAERRGAVVAFTVGACGVVLPLLLALAGADFLDARNVLPAIVPLAVAAGAGMAARRAGVAGAAACVTLVAVSVVMVVALQHDAEAQRPGWSRVAAALTVGRQPRAILLRGTGTWARSLNFYLPHVWWLPRRGARVTEIDVLRRPPLRHACTDRTWWGAACDVTARARRATPPVPGFRLVSSRRLGGFAIERYLSAAPRRVFRFPPYGRPTELRQARRGRRRHMLVTPAASPGLR